MELDCAVQNYDWGKRGRASAVARLQSCLHGIDEALPYAELWMGTHVSGPSVIRRDGSLLKDALDGRDLPYLFKVLSVNKALSIQAHPDKALAERLHAERPNVGRVDMILSTNVNSTCLGVQGR